MNARLLLTVMFFATSAASANTGGTDIGSSELDAVLPGYFACVGESGTILAGGIDGEVNVANLRVMQAGAKGSTPLKIQSASLMKTFELEAVQPLPEESIVYTIRANSIKGISQAKITEQAGESIVTENAVCTVKFKAGI